MAKRGKVTRVTVDCNPQQYKRLTNMATESGATKAQVIRNSVALACYVREVMKTGCEIKVHHPGGQIEKCPYFGHWEDSGW